MSYSRQCLFPPNLLRVRVSRKSRTWTLAFGYNIKNIHRKIILINSNDVEAGSLRYILEARRGGQPRFTAATLW